MSKWKKTKWYPARIKPVHVGVYETESPYGGGGRFQHWNGSFWGLYMPSVDSAMRVCKEKSRIQNTKWRGLAQPPKESK